MARRNTFQDVFKYYDLTGGLHDGKVHHELCWPWTGSLNAKGIPYFSVDGKSYVAHRIVYHLFHPTEFLLTDSRLIRHVVCDNGICGNHSHMEPGSHQQNMNDAVQHSRFGLTLDEINAILQMKESFPDITQERIAERVSYQFKRNIARSTVGDVLTDRRRERRKGLKDG